MTAQPNPSPSFEPGAAFGKYTILSRLAIGGMAELFLAQPHRSERIVVLKRILPQLSLQTEFVSMFLDEARIAATIEHPNVVQVFDVGVENGSYFFTMEFIHGVDVRTLIYVALRQGLRVPLDVALHVICELARGLHHAHHKLDFDGAPLNIIHRDVTPQNGLIGYDGTVKLADFGIAKASNRLNETRFGVLKGKVGYMSPEQCTGQELDLRSDVYSLGIMLYELTVCRRLFRGKSDFAILKQIVEQPIPRPSASDPLYPPELERIVLKALQRDKAQRYPTAQALVDELTKFAEASWLRLDNETTRTFLNKVFAEQIAEFEAAKKSGNRDALIETLVPLSAPSEESMFPQRTSSSGIKRAVAERAALLQSLHRQRKSPNEPLPLDPNEFATLDTSGLRDAPDYQPEEGESTEVPHEPEATPSEELVPPRSPPGIWIAVGIALAALAFGVWLVRGKQATKPIEPAPIAAAPDPTPTPTPNPTPTVPPVVEPAPLAAAPTPMPQSPHAQSSRPTRKKSPKPTTSPPSLAAASQGEGKLILVTTPWVNVAIDGKVRGQTPLSIALPAGDHQLVLTNGEQGITRSLKITIPANEVVRKKLDF